jgi:hypothetical protein
MDKHYSIYSNKNEKISDNLEDECKLCFLVCNSTGKQIFSCPKYGGERRQGKIVNNKGTTFLCDLTKTTKLFRDKLEALSYAYYDLIIPKQQLYVVKLK